MTKAEKLKILEAIECFSAENDNYHKGMDILCHLVGSCHQVYHDLTDKQAKITTVNAFETVVPRGDKEAG